MTGIEDIKDAVRRLPPEDLARFREWFFELDAAVWDRQIAEDEKAGRLDDLVAEGLKDYHAGRTRPL